MNIMKQYMKLMSVTVGLFTAAATSINAQTLRSAYFLEGMTYRHELNPAFMGERGYVSIPALGNLQFGFNSTAGLSHFLFPTNDGKLTTFMSESVSRKEFLDGLPSRLKLDLDLQETILSFGFHAWGGFNTFGITLKSNTTFGIPVEMFRFMKDPSETEYHLKNFGLTSTNYAEIALGHAREINSQWTVGGKVKVLVGLAKASLHVDDMTMTMKDNYWKIDPNGAELNVAVSGMTIPTKGETKNYDDTDYELDDNGDRTEVLKEGTDNQLSLNDIDFDSGEIGPTGMGVAFDLGATYKLNEDWMFSASILDLGFIAWKNTIRGNITKSFEFNGFQEIPLDETDDNKHNSLENQADRLLDDLVDLSKFDKVGDDEKYTKALAATLLLGAQYTLPVYDRLKFGFLSTTRIQGPNSWTEGRLSANIAPLSAFEMGVNYALSNFGSTFGFMLNSHGAGFNVFVGADIPLTKYEPKYFVPTGRFGLQFNMGFNITFGSKYKPKYKCVEVQTL